MGDKIKFIRKDILNLSQNKLAKSFNVCYKNKSLLVIKFDIKLFLAPSFIKKENKRQSLKLSLD